MLLSDFCASQALRRAFNDDSAGTECDNFAFVSKTLKTHVVSVIESDFQEIRWAIFFRACGRNLCVRSQTPSRRSNAPPQNLLRGCF